ncbi:MAG TPA: class I SAM-dependent methyltransferase, partial [Thermoanaerobaculia bacterium]|nr:class I SAM-dependent methyltransferase [Thermoanaerobaculia bacterium]
SQTSTAEAVTGDHPLVQELRQRHARLSAPDDRGERNERARTFELRLPDRSAHVIGGPGEPAFTVQIVTDKGLAALSAFDELAVAEAYMNGDLDLEGDLLAALKHRPVLADPHPFKYLYSTYLEPLLRGQVERDKTWIKSHYDVDRDFFLLWLDSRLRAYSHGFFERDDESLEDGMERKFRYAFDACGIRPGQRVLDIGGGWGSFLQFAGEQGVRVTSITISDESERTMRELIARRGLPCEVVKEHFLEYKPVGSEPFDAIVNLGVTEHLPDYRRTLAQYQRLLKPGRRVYLDAYSGARHGMPSFISKWVFQGNTSPLNLEKYLAEVARTPFEVVVIKNDRHNYFLSCKKWAENLEAKRDEVIARWGRHLYRRFVLYLWSAANSFETGMLSAHHMILQLPAPGSAHRAGLESWA